MSTEESLTLDKRLALVGFSKDAEPFIVVDTDKCNHCESKPCLYICPAEVYAWKDKLNYNTQGCMANGACLIVCHKIGAGAISWKYPSGGKGVAFKLG